MAAILPISEFLPQIPCTDKIVQGAFYGAAGHPQFPGHGRDSRPAAFVPVRTVMEIHIDCHRPVRQSGSVDGFKISHIPSFSNPSAAAACLRACGAVTARSSLVSVPAPYRRLQALLMAQAALQTLPGHRPSVCAGSPAPV